jgi:hypothetical protein
MLIASIGQDIGPISYILRELEIPKLVLIRYDGGKIVELLEEINEVSPNTMVEVHSLNPPNLNQTVLATDILHQLYRNLIQWTERTPNAFVSVTGGTPWLSHTLHHAATMANLPVVVNTFSKVEGSEQVFSYPKPLETERMKTILLNGHRPRVDLLLHLQSVKSAIIPELSKALNLNIETIRFILNGRERNSSVSQDIIASGLVGMDQPLVEVSGKRKTRKRGPQAFEYNLTEFGRDVSALLQRLE